MSNNSTSLVAFESGVPSDLRPYMFSYDVRPGLPPRAEFRFPNGYGASIIPITYLPGDPTLEMAVLVAREDGSYALTYETEITSDVERYASFDELWIDLRRQQRENQRRGVSDPRVNKRVAELTNPAREGWRP